MYACGFAQALHILVATKVESLSMQTVGKGECGLQWASQAIDLVKQRIYSFIYLSDCTHNAMSFNNQEHLGLLQQTIAASCAIDMPFRELWLAGHWVVSEALKASPPFVGHGIQTGHSAANVAHCSRDATIFGLELASKAAGSSGSVID